MTYGIKNVVGGFGRPMSPEEALPYTLARTYLEHQDLRSFLRERYIRSAIELGCGYGRNLQVLKEFSPRVLGVERDEELVKVASKLNPDCEIYHGVVTTDFAIGSQVDLVLTFTFLQHLNDDEWKETMAQIQRLAGISILMCEETDARKNDSHCFCRPVPDYQKALLNFDLSYTRPRKIEPTFPGRDSGTYMLFTRRN